jgi:hypothetical protein
MKPSATLPLQPATRDEDLIEQARPGHGIPSQDPDLAAQFPLGAEGAEREANSVLAGGGLVGGTAIGATVGLAVGGPVGVVLGGTLGAVAGTLGGLAAGTIMNDGDPSADPLPSDSGSAPKNRPAITGGAKV